MFGRERSRSPHQAANRGGDWFCPSCHDHQFAKNACCRNCGAPKPDDPSQCGPPDAATFLRDHIIDDAVLLRFLSLTADQQQVVIMRGTLSGARDPSAVLSSRITQVLQGHMTATNPNPKPANAGGHGDQNQMMMQMMQMMMQQAGGQPGMQGMGMQGMGMPIVPRQGDWYCQQCGDHQFAKNALCRNCGAARPTDGTETIPPSAEKFLAMHPGLEDHAVAKFRSLDQASQLIVIKRGSLNGSRDGSNPNAVLLGRIKTVQQQGVLAQNAPSDFGRMGGGGMGMGMAGMGHQMGTGVPGNGIQPCASDWYCPNCYDLQFRNNDVCRICGTSREFGVKDISSLDPATFLAGHQIEPQAVQQFHNLPEEQKKIVMSGGSLHGARDPTAVLINRMAKARAGHGGGHFAPKQQAPQQGGMDMQMMQNMQQMMMQMMQAQGGASTDMAQQQMMMQQQGGLGGSVDLAQQQQQLALAQQPQLQHQQLQQPQFQFHQGGMGGYS